MIVLDASFVGPLTLPDELPIPPEIALVLRDATLVVPMHWHLEVASLLHAARRRDRITQHALDEAVMRLRALVVDIDTQTPVAAWSETLRLADAHGLTPYDAAYLELALRRMATLATLDRALLRAAQTVGLSIMTFTR